MQPLIKKLSTVFTVESRALAGQEKTAELFSVRWLKLHKQSVIFQMDVFHQIIDQLFNPGVQRAPGIAGTGGRRRIVSHGQ